MATDDPLQAYVERLLELRDDERALPQPDVLRRMARDLGLTDADLARAEALADDHWTRGRGFLAHGLHDDAIRELREALVLRPGHLETMIALAQAYVGRWRRDGDGESRREAERLARACLAVEPDHAPAFAILRELEQPDLAPRRRLVLGAAVVAMLVALGAGFFLISSPSTDEAETPEVVRPDEPPPAVPAEKTPVAPPEIPAEEEKKSPEASARGAISPEEQAAAPRSQTLPVEFEGPDGFGWTTGFARLNNYPERSFFKLGGLVRNETDRVISRLELELTLLDAEGRLLARDDTNLALSMFHPAMRPGDTFPVSRIVRTDARAARARLRVISHEGDPAPRAWPPSRPVALAWDVRQPPGIEIEIRERSVEGRKKFRGPGYFHMVTLEVTNRSEVPIPVLKLEVRRLAADGAPVGKETRIVAGGTGAPPLFAGETRVIRQVESTAEPVTDYTVAVAKISLE